MKDKSMTILACAAIICAASCDKLRLPSDESQTGTIEICFVEDPALTKAGQAAIPDTNDFILSISDSSGERIYHGKYGAAPQTILARVGAYTIDIVSREFSEPLFDAPQYGDSQVVSVNAGQNTRVLLSCRQLNSGMKLRIAENFLTTYPDASLMLRQDRYSLLYSYSEKRIAYFKPGAVSLILTHGATDDILFTRTLNAQEVLCLNVSAGTLASSESGIGVSVDTTRIWSSEDYVIGGGSQGSSVRDAISVSEARNCAGRNDVWVYGYIVGGDLSSSKCSFEAPFTSRTNIVLAAKSSCRDKSQCVSVQLAQGDIRNALNLVDNPENLGRQVLVKGDIVAAYYGIPGIQGLMEYQWK